MRDVIIKAGIAIPGRELETIVSRSGGPGGQNVNKVSSKVTLRWAFQSSEALSPTAKNRLQKIAENRISLDGKLQVTSQSSRDQPQNLQACIVKLRQLVLQAIQPPKIRKLTQPSLGSKLRRLDNKAKRSQAKDGRRNQNWE
jgi:ribosome-associated protein